MNKNLFHHLALKLMVSLLLLLAAASGAGGQGTAFTYQGKLSDGGNPATGNYDFQFKLFDTVTVGTGTQQGSAVTVSSVTVANGIFTVQLDFGACPSCFNGAARFLEIAVKPTSAETFTTLGPRQPITANPYAFRSLNAANAMTADGLSVACVNCVTSSQIASVNGSAVSGTIPVESVPAGSGNYIQNTTTQQASSNFNISGSGTAAGMLSGSVVNAAQQYNLGGNRILSAAGTANLFAGINAGTNTTGDENAFFGDQAGYSNTTGSANAFFGNGAGFSNTTGYGNAFFGRNAGRYTDSTANAFFGTFAGLNNTTGSSNTFFGASAGYSLTAGSENTFIGAGTDLNGSNPTGNRITLLGDSARADSGLTNATAIGYLAKVTQSNTLVLGSINGVNYATADTNVGIGTTAPAAKLHVRGVSPVRILGDTTTLSGSEYVDFFARTSIYGTDLGGMRIQRQVGSGDIDTLLFAAASGNSAAEVMRVKGNGKVGINIVTPLAMLHVFGDNEIGVYGKSNSYRGVYGESYSGIGVRGYSYSGIGVSGYSYNGLAGSFTGDVEVTGSLSVDTLGGAGATALCRNASNQIATCSSSLRYKTDVRPFAGGLDLINQLRPIRFTWKQGGMRDVGLAAEEVAAADEEFIFRNDKGQVEGVKYDQLSALFINAFKEQQAQIRQQQTLLEQQQRLIKEQQRRLEALTKLVCSTHRKAKACK